MASQQGAAVVQPPLDRGDRERKEVADARDRPPLVVEQEQNSAVVGREIGKRAGEPFMVVVAGERVGRVFGPPGGGEGKFAAFGNQRAVYVGGRDGFGSAVLRADTQRAVPRDGVQPAGELGRLAQLRQRLERDQEGVLGDVLGGPVSRRAQRLRGDVGHGPPEPAHEFVKGRQVADECGEHQLLVRDFRVTRPQVGIVGCLCRAVVHAAPFWFAPIVKESGARRADRKRFEEFRFGARAVQETAACSANGTRTVKGASMPIPYALFETNLTPAPGAYHLEVRARVANGNTPRRVEALPLCG